MMAVPGTSSEPPARYVRHAFWKYPLIAVAIAAALVVLAVVAGSPNWPRATLQNTDTKDPGGALLAMTMELDGMSASWSNKNEPGMPGTPAETFVIVPVRAHGELLHPHGAVSDALTQYDQATPDQRLRWASNYHQALDSITPISGGSQMGGMGAVQSPDYMKVDSLTGDFGPVPVLVKADLELAQDGELDDHLEGLEPGHTLHLVNIALYDRPLMLNQATAEGLTDDQWGMIKERGFAVGPWYLIVPAIIHVELPGGSNGLGFALWNGLFALIVILALPLIPGLRDLPRRLKLYRLIYRYPIPSDQSLLEEQMAGSETRSIRQ